MRVVPEFVMYSVGRRVGLVLDAVSRGTINAAVDAVRDEARIDILRTVARAHFAVNRGVLEDVQHV
ncbi:MAG: hypothetical protein LBT97_03225 [Planctomycetota bacterium]|jgi:hypothetical protein|nr:hypothetical protein [Planctomycetota bacterium]